MVIYYYANTTLNEHLEMGHLYIQVLPRSLACGKPISSLRRTWGLRKPQALAQCEL